MINLLGFSFIAFISRPVVDIGLILLVIGLVTVILAKRITRVERHSNEVSNKDRLYVMLKIIGLVIMLAGFICISVDLIIFFVRK